MSNSQNASPTIGLKRLVVWPLVEDSKNNLEYDEPYEFGVRLMTLSDDPSIAQGSIDADDMVAESLVAVDGGKITVGVTDLTAVERQMLLGEVMRNGTNITSTKNFSGYVCLACMTERADGKYNLKKYPKVKFVPGSESNTTRKKGTVEFVTQNLSGEYYTCINNHESRAVRYEVPEDDEIVNQWFTDAKYIGPEGASSEPETTTTGDDTPEG